MVFAGMRSKFQSFLFVCFQVIIIQPQAPSNPDGSPADLPSPEAPTVKSPQKKKKEEDPEVNQLYYSDSTAGGLMKPGSDSSSSVAENRLHGGPWPRHHRAAGRWVHSDSQAGNKWVPADSSEVRFVFQRSRRRGRRGRGEAQPTRPTAASSSPRWEPPETFPDLRLSGRLQL